ncbi:MAG: anaerobic ribonucleoside-triphosphate reductase activating protein [Geobacteraceae bacterium]
MLKIGGMTPFTTIDYPDHLAAVLFCRGCPWRCDYCHNQGLMEVDAPGNLCWDKVLAFLESRRGLLDAVVFSGGEPTLQTTLRQAVLKVRDMGFFVGLHTAGAFPEKLKEVLPHLNWIGLDIKAPFHDYERVTGVPGSGEAARESALLVRESGVVHQFRTTLDPILLSEGRLESLRQMVEMEWGSDLVLQNISQL